MEIQGNDIIAQTKEEEKEQQERLNSLLDAVNSQNEEFYDKKQKEQEEQERLDRENEQRLRNEEKAVFSMVSEKERQKLLQRIAEEERLAEEENNARREAKKSSFKKLLGNKEKKKEEPLLQETASESEKPISSEEKDSEEKEPCLKEEEKKEEKPKENPTLKEPSDKAEEKPAVKQTPKLPKKTKREEKKEGLLSKVKDSVAGLHQKAEINKLKSVAKRHKELAAQQKKMEELEKIAFMDSLTGLSNRTKLEKMKESARKDYTYVSIDANNLKYLNDTYGHEKGDLLLKVIGEGVKLAFGKNGYRMGGDEFCALCFQVLSERHLQKSITMLRDYLKAKEKKATDGMLYSVAIGYATSKEAETLTEVMGLADKRMYEDKAAYKEANPQYDLRRAVPKEEEPLEETAPPEEEIVEEIKAEDLTEEEYDSMLDEETLLAKKEALSKSINAEVSLDQIIHKMLQHNTIEDPLYLIAIASVDMNTLVLIHDINAFIDLCNEEEDGEIDIISCSYIYAIHKSGGHWYGSSNATPAIKTMFDMMSGLIVANRGNFKEKEILTIPNINMFKDIYTQ